jgi:hypothetical protein
MNGQRMPSVTTSRPVALVREPSPHLANGLVTHLERSPIDVDLALRQWEAYVQVLREHDWHVVPVPPAPECADSVFVEDAVLMYRNVAIITRPGALERRGETPAVETVVEALGCSINRIREPGTLDGGDVLKVGDTLYVDQPAVESLLRQFPQHQLNWRELSLTPAPDPTYLLWLDRLTNACTQTQQDARAVELGLHLSTLHSPAKLLPILPAAARADRFPEVLELLDRLEKSAASANQASPTLTRAETCYQQQDIDSARRLLEHRLEQAPAHLPTLRLSLQVKSHALPPMQTAILWRRHLQQHPDDLFAHQLLVDAWLAANQPSAAVNHLLATDSSRLDTDLRLRTAQLALENRQNAAFPRAIQRLLDAKDPTPAESLSLWTQHLQALKLPTLATALQMD